MISSSKQSTQKRMLSPKRMNNTSLAKLGARSPQSKNIYTKKTQNRTSFTSQQKTRDQSKQIMSPGRRGSTLVKSKQHKIGDNNNSVVQQDSIELPNGDRYTGGIKDGRMYGKGTYDFYSTNMKYQGEFYDNKFHGWGVLLKITAGNMIPIFQGYWQYGQKQGSGKYYYGEGHYYNGDWLQDMKHGKGIYQFYQGLYNGEWRHNMKQGNGSLKLNDETQYKGIWKQDQFIKGLIRYSNGDEYSGDIYNGLRQGQGSYYSITSQQRYKGEWKNNVKHGRGMLFMKNGDQLQCNFDHGNIDWTQSCTYKWNSGVDSGSVFNGWFKDGMPEKGHVIQSNGEEYDTY